MQRGAPSGKFLIARCDQRSPKAAEFRMTRAIVRENRLDRYAVGQLDRIFRAADDFLEAAKKKNLHARCL